MRTILSVGACLLVAACTQQPHVAVYEPSRDLSLSLSPGERVTLIANSASHDGAVIPRCLRDELKEAMPGLDLMPASDFRAMVGHRFATTPKSDDDIEAVLTDPPVQAAVRRQGLRYLVIVGSNTGESIRTAHAHSFEGRNSHVWARVWDVSTAERLGEFSASTSSSTELFSVPLIYTGTEREACARVARSLAERLT